MGLTFLIDDPIYQGNAPTSTEVPNLFPVGIAGRSYLVKEDESFRRESIEFLRAQADQSSTPGEYSITPDDLWRRAQESWHHGAGQTFFDRPDSDRSRFRSSKGVDVWTKHQASLLPATDQKRSSANTNLALAVAGSYLYLADGNEVYFTQDVTVDSPTWTAAAVQAGEAAQSVRSICSDGKTVYAALGTNGIHTTTRGDTTSTHYNALAATLVAYVKGRLMAAKDNSIYNVTASGGAPAALLTHANSDFAWVGFAAGQGHIYAAGYSGDKSLVYRTAVKADGTALDTPQVAGELPDGEIVRSIVGYLGRLFVGTDKGWRMVGVDDNGDFAASSDIVSTSSVRCFEPQDRFVWFGWTNYDATSTGLGRADLSQFTSGINPAYASDLMVTGQGAVLSVVTFQDRTVFAVSALGVYGEDSNKVSTGTVDSGLVTFGLPDPKVAMFLDVRHTALAGSHKAYLSVDGGTFESVGSHSATGSSSLGVEFPVGQKKGETFEVRHELNRSSTAPTTGPTVTRSTLRAYPAPSRVEVFYVPVILDVTVRIAGRNRSMDPKEEFDFLLDLERDADVVIFQEGTASHSVVIRNHRWMPEQRTDDRKFWNGVLLLEMRSLS